MNVEFIAFTAAGERHARRLAACLPEGAQANIARGFGEDRCPLGAWTAQAFSCADALVFVGAAGIAVRAIAPHVRNKVHDPAVIVADEAGRWVIPLLSGHIGGANRLARLLAAGCGAQPVLTTATDVRGVWAVDDWAASRGMTVANPARIKAVSSGLLAGGRVSVACDLPLAGQVPDGVDLVALDEFDPGSAAFGECAPEPAVAVGISPFRRRFPDATLRVIPSRVRVGVGCRRGTASEAIEHAVDEALLRAGVEPRAVGELRSIDLKKDEPGLLEAARRRGLADEVLLGRAAGAGCRFVRLFRLRAAHCRRRQRLRARGGGVGGAGAFAQNGNRRRHRGGGAG